MDSKKANHGISVAAQVFETKNYSIFEINSFNRDVKRVERVEKLFMEYGWINAYPMHVVKSGSGKLTIISGHHRFKAAMNLGIPVKFVVCKPSEISIHELEWGTNPWDMQDYLRSYIRCGKSEYKEVDEYVQQTGIPLSSSISLLSGESAGSANKVDSFKHGKYKTGDKSIADDVREVVLFMKSIGLDFSKTALFVNALSKCLWVPEFRKEHFISKLKTWGSQFEKQRTVEAYLKEIEKVYNRQVKINLQIPIQHLATITAIQRQQTFGKNK